MLEFLTVQTLNGLVYGMLLFILALGLSLIFGLMRVVNLAHGSFFMIGAYVGLSAWHLTGSFWTAAATAAAAVGLVAMVLERLWLRRFYGRSDLDQVILTFGFALVFIDIAKAIWGAAINSLPTPHGLQGSLQIAETTFPAYRLFIILAGAALFVVTWLIVERTSAGALIRAAVWDRDMVSGLGFNIRAVFATVFALGGMLAGLGGVLGGPILGVYPGLDFEILITTLIVVVVGGLGSISGAFWGSVLIGISESFGKALVPEFSMFLVFALMAAVLLVRSSGKAEEEVE